LLQWNKNTFFENKINTKLFGKNAGFFAFYYLCNMFYLRRLMVFSGSFGTQKIDAKKKQLHIEVASVWVAGFEAATFPKFRDAQN
jgi:hypothetical protein